MSVKLAPNVTLASGTVKYYPTAAPADEHIVAANVSGGPGATLATFDTTVLSNGTYVLQLDGTDTAGNQKTSVVLLTVTGDYKPGRVVVEVTDFTVPVAGIPITIGRRYDSLEKDTVGDFGHGWSLTVGHPKLEVNPNFGVTVTLPNGRRTTFDLTLEQLTIDWVNGPIVPPWLGGIFNPVYRGEPGVFGKLTTEGACPLVRYNPANTANPLPCFFAAALVPAYAPELYVYTDPYGTAYTMAPSGELKTIKDRQGNTLSFEANGIISNSGRSVAFERDPQGRITKVTTPPFFSANYNGTADYKYVYDTAGDLVTVELPDLATFHHTYAAHRLLTTTDPRDNPARTSTYHPDGRLATDTDAEGHTTSYAYDLATRTTTTTLPDDNGFLTQVFDARGMLLTETDPLNHTTTHVYDADRNETSRTNAMGEITTATYDHGNQTSVTRHTTPPVTSETTYDPLNNLPVAFKDELGHTTGIEYDDRGVPSRIFDELGTRYSFTSSEQGVPLAVDDAAGKRAYLDYDAAGNVTGRTDWIGRVTRIGYDQTGNVRTETTARGGTKTHRVNPRGKRLATIDEMGNQHLIARDANDNVQYEQFHQGEWADPRTMIYSYDALNRVTQIQYEVDGPTVSYTRDFRGNPLTMTDELNHTTTYLYDKAGRLIKTTFHDTTFTARTYDALDRLKTVTDELDHTTTYDYEPGCGCSDRVTTVTDPLGRTTTTGYDALGRRTSVTDANSHTTTFEYDVRGHLTDTHYHDGTSTHDEYDPRGRRIWTRDQMNQTTHYGYDDQGQLTSVTDPLGNATLYGYDADGNLASVTDANSHATSYEFDLLKRKTKRTLPLGQFETFTHDAIGNVLTHTDFRDKTTTMVYDRRNRMLSKSPDPSLIGETAHHYTYTLTGMRQTSTDASGTTSYTYDARDRILTKATSGGTLTYTYYDNGNLKTIRSSNTNGTSVDYAWDDANQLISVTDNRTSGGVALATYGQTGRPATLSYTNGIGVTYAYDNPLDRVTSMTWRQGSSPAFASWAYNHNQRGQRLSATDITGRSAAYGYDLAARLASETVSGDPRGATYNGALSYVLDGAGNRLSRTSTLAALASATHTYDANDQLANDSYDANGNTITSGADTFTYDFENRLTSKNNGAVTVTYDCDGNRVAKTAGGVTTQYLVDDLNPTGYLQVLEEVSGGAVQSRYTYGRNLVSQTRGVSSTPATSYYGYDAHGNISFLTDATGAVTDSYDYDAWGNVVASTGSTANTRLYTGEELDPDLGLLNLRARQYKPGTGRFLTLDPEMGRIGSPRSFNRFAYTGGDPVNFIDPSGRMEAAQYTALAGMGLSVAGMATVLTMSKVKKTDTFIGVDSWPVPAVGEKKKVDCDNIFRITVGACYGQEAVSTAGCIAKATLEWLLCKLGGSASDPGD